MLQLEREVHERRLAGIARLETRLSFRLAILQRLLDRQITRILGRYGMSLAAYRVLVTIDAFEETSATELVRMIAVDKALVSRSAADLIAAGLLEARTDPANARRKLLRLTPAGHARLDEVTPAIDARNAGLDALFDERERAAFEHGLDKLTRHAAQALADEPDTETAA